MKYISLFKLESGLETIYSNKLDLYLFSYITQQNMEDKKEGNLQKRRLQQMYLLQNVLSKLFYRAAVVECYTSDLEQICG